MTFNYRDSGSFTSAAAAAFHDVVLPHGMPDKFVLRNRTAWGDDAAETSVESYRWLGMAEEAFQSMDQTVTSGILSTEAGTTNGFRFIDTTNPPIFASLLQTNVSRADPAVVTMADTGTIQAGSIVRLVDTTGQLQSSGYDIEVTAVSVNTNITLNLDTTNFAAVGTAGSVRRYMPGLMFPRNRYIMPIEGAVGITQAANAVVGMTVSHDFSVGEKVSFRVRSSYGMKEINNKVATVLSVGNISGGVYTADASGATVRALQVDLDTTGFTAFLPPTSAEYLDGVSQAMLVPAGSGPEVGANPPGAPLTAAFDNRNRFVMRCGTNVVTSTSAVYDWEALYSNSHVAE